MTVAEERRSGSPSIGRSDGRSGGGLVVRATGRWLDRRRRRSVRRSFGPRWGFVRRSGGRSPRRSVLRSVRRAAGLWSHRPTLNPSTASPRRRHHGPACVARARARRIRRSCPSSAIARGRQRARAWGGGTAPARPAIVASPGDPPLRRARGASWSMRTWTSAGATARSPVRSPAFPFRRPERPPASGRATLGRLTPLARRSRRLPAARRTHAELVAPIGLAADRLRTGAFSRRTTPSGGLPLSGGERRALRQVAKATSIRGPRHAGHPPEARVSSAHLLLRRLARARRKGQHFCRSTLPFQTACKPFGISTAL